MGFASGTEPAGIARQFIEAGLYAANGRGRHSAIFASGTVAGCGKAVSALVVTFSCVTAELAVRRSFKGEFSFFF